MEFDKILDTLKTFFNETLPNFFTVTLMDFFKTKYNFGIEGWEGLEGWIWSAIGLAVFVLLIVIIVAAGKGGEEDPVPEGDPAQIPPVGNPNGGNNTEIPPVGNLNSDENPIGTPTGIVDSQSAVFEVYHVAKRRTDSKWQVRKPKSEHAIKLFATYVEAIDFAKKLAANQNAYIIIHKEDGSFRKITCKKY